MVLNELIISINLEDNRVLMQVSLTEPLVPFQTINLCIHIILKMNSQ